MPKKHQHLAQANHNEDFVAKRDLIASEFNDWAMIAIFHAALHYVEAYFDDKLNFHNTNHPERAMNIRKCLRQIQHDYEDLKNDAKSARYDLKTFTLNDFDQYIIPQLERIKSHIKAEISAK